MEENKGGIDSNLKDYVRKVDGWDASAFISGKFVECHLASSFSGKGPIGVIRDIESDVVDLDGINLYSIIKGLRVPIVQYRKDVELEVDKRKVDSTLAAEYLMAPNGDLFLGEFRYSFSKDFRGDGERVSSYDCSFVEKDKDWRDVFFGAADNDFREGILPIQYRENLDVFNIHDQIIPEFRNLEEKVNSNYSCRLNQPSRF